MVASSSSQAPAQRAEWLCPPVLGLAALAFLIALASSWLAVASWRVDKGAESQLARLRSGGALPILHATLETLSTESELSNAGSELWEAQNRQNTEKRQQVATLTSQQAALDSEVRELQQQTETAKTDSTKGVQAQLQKLEAETAGLTRLNASISDLKAAVQAQNAALSPAQAAAMTPFDPAITEKWQSAWAQTPEVEKAIQEIEAAAALRASLTKLQADGEKADRAAMVATKKSYDEAVAAASQAASQATQKLDSLRAAAEAELKALTPASNP